MRQRDETNVRWQLPKRDSPLQQQHRLQSLHHPLQVRLLQNHIEVGFDVECNVCSRHARFSRVGRGEGH